MIDSLLSNCRRGGQERWGSDYPCKWNNADMLPCGLKICAPQHKYYSRVAKHLATKQKEDDMSLFGDIGVATRNGLKKMIESRESRVRGHIHANLLTLGDEDLAKAGYSRSELTKTATTPFPYL